jgi:hypothetical protein
MFGYDEMLVLIGFQTARGPEAQPGHSIWHGGLSAWFGTAGFEKGNLWQTDRFNGDWRPFWPQTSLASHH